MYNFDNFKTRTNCTYFIRVKVHYTFYESLTTRK